jgi:uncharacterized membrane protein YraQ (UPF0718 family)
MTATLVVLALAAVAALIVAARAPATARPRLGQASTEAFEQFLLFLPRITIAIVAAGFIARLLPNAVAAHLIGPESGAKGILIASVVGGFVPSGPFVSFPIVVALDKAGAGTPQLIAFLTAWSVFAFHRVLIYESTLMGWRFSATRLVASLPLPPAAGFLAAAVEAAVHRLF